MRLVGLPLVTTDASRVRHRLPVPIVLRPVRPQREPVPTNAAGHCRPSRTRLCPAYYLHPLLPRSNAGWHRTLEYAVTPADCLCRRARDTWRISVGAGDRYHDTLADS